MVGEVIVGEEVSAWKVTMEKVVCWRNGSVDVVVMCHYICVHIRVHIRLFTVTYTYNIDYI